MKTFSKGRKIKLEELIKILQEVYLEFGDLDIINASFMQHISEIYVEKQDLIIE